MKGVPRANTVNLDLFHPVVVWLQPEIEHTYKFHVLEREEKVFLLFIFSYLFFFTGFPNNHDH